MYCEHVGKNRHEGGKSGEISLWYALMRKARRYFIGQYPR
jgi:hypothetical protein